MKDWCTLAEILVLAAGGFFLGSVMFSRLLPLWLRKTDVCAESRDRNPGAANVFIHCGWPLGLLCLALDLFKGFLPVFLAVRLGMFGEWYFAVIAAAPVLGHAVAPFNGFHGGKCIAAAFGVLLGMLGRTPVVLLLAGLYILFSTLLKISPVRRRSILVFTLFGLFGSGFELYGGHLPAAVGCALISATAAVRHIHAPDAPAQQDDPLPAENS